MSEMVERVAKAIFEWEYRDMRRPRPEVHPEWSIYLGAARAAIEAMRDPTGEMRTAYRRRLEENHTGIIPDGYLLEAWHAAIDQARK